MDIGITIRKQYSICPGYESLGSSGRGLKNGHHISTDATISVRCCTMWIGWYSIAVLYIGGGCQSEMTTLKMMKQWIGLVIVRATAPIFAFARNGRSIHPGVPTRSS